MIISERTLNVLFYLDIVLSIVISLVLLRVNPDIGFWTTAGIIAGLQVVLVALPWAINFFGRRRTRSAMK